MNRNAFEVRSQITCIFAVNEPFEGLVTESSPDYPETADMNQVLLHSRPSEIDLKFWETNSDYVGLLSCECLLHFLPSIILAVLDCDSDGVLTDDLLIVLRSDRRQGCFSSLAKERFDAVRAFLNWMAATAVHPGDRRAAKRALSGFWGQPAKSGEA